MTVQGISSKSAYDAIGPSGKSSQTSDLDEEIKMLESQKETINKQIEQYKTAKDANSDSKQKLIKNLENQVIEIDAQIQQKQIEKAKEKVTDAAKSDDNNADANGSQNDKGNMQQGLTRDAQKAVSQIETYNRYGKLASMSKTSKAKAAELQSDADFEASAGGKTTAGKLYEESAEMRSQGNEELSSAARQASKINKKESAGGEFSNGIKKEKETSENRTGEVLKQKDEDSKDTDGTAS